MKKLISNIAWLWREYSGKCHVCKTGYMTTKNEPNGDAELLELPLLAYCNNCAAKRYI